ncbi:MAG: hypothetical protein V2A79_19590, partial [Planctomycetota bacterium]
MNQDFDIILGMATDLEQKLRDVAQRSGLSMKALADRSGLHYASIHGFLRSGCGLTLESAGKLCAA